GGPGTGKTLTTRVIVEIFKQKNATILLGAPTGKAAKRLESCGHEAKTIHRLLEYSPKLGGFQKGEKSPLECDVLIIDESSMADISLIYHLIQAVPYGAHLVIIGDADQLPSVGPGLVMRHLVTAGVLPLTILNQIYRQQEGSGIVQIAHYINKGIIPKQTDFSKDCIFLHQENPVQAVTKVVEVVTKLRAEGVEAQVISPMHKGEAGTIRLNEVLQDTLNPIPHGEKETYQIESGFRKFRVNDRVIQMKNDYDKEVFNGDSGIIESIDHEEQQLTVSFDGRGSVVYDFLDLDQLALSYAITVHKSQGSEYHTIIVLCLTQHYIMLARNLLYTAVSRAKKRAIIVGAPKAMSIAIRNDKQKARYTRLKERLISIPTSI
ncbi:MAG: AAA family ATPase, partial [Smithella sp.]